MIKRKNGAAALGAALIIMMSLVGVTVLMSCGNEKTSSGGEPLVVAMELQFPPFEMTSAEGKPTGISVEMAKALGDALGRPVKIENTAWVGLIPSLQTGKADLIISSMSITEERKKVVDFSDPYAFSGLTLLIHGESSVKSYRDLSQPGVVTAVKTGTTGALWAQDNLPSDQVRIYDEVAACALEVSQGKADAFIYDPLTTFSLQQKFTGSTRVNLENLPGTVGGWGVALKKGREDLRQGVNNFIADFRENGGFKRLEKKYLTELAAEFERADLPSFFEEGK